MILYLLLCDIKLLLALLEALNIDDLRSPSHTFCFQYILKYYLYHIVAYYMDSSIILKIVKNHILIKQLIAKKKCEVTGSARKMVAIPDRRLLQLCFL